jgi:MarR family transcriptional regulator, organic hydroperoxide resistance regulator
VPGRIQHELQQRKPVGHIEEEAWLNIQRTADLLMQRVTDILRPYELTPTQYNVLRILRGAGDEGANCKDIGSRMITRDPDITRLLDRLDKRALITRSRSQGDRRYVSIRITEEGLRVLSELDKPIVDLTTRVLGHLGRERAESLIGILEEIRAGIGSEHGTTVPDASHS